MVAAPVHGAISMSQINIAVIVVVCLWLLQAFGIIGSIGNIRLR